MSFINPNPAGGGGGGAVTSVNGQVGVVVLTAANVGAQAIGAAPTLHAATHGVAGTDPVTLAQSQVTGLTAALALLAPLASPALTGIPTAPTAANGTNTTQIATTAFVLANAVAAPGVPNATRVPYVDAAGAFAYSANFTWLNGAQQLIVTGAVGGTAGVFSQLALAAVTTMGIGPSFGSPDTLIARDAVSILAQRNGNSAQTYRIYGRYVSGADNEYGFMNHTTGVGFTVGTAQNGANPNYPLILHAGGADRWRIGGNAGTFEPMANNAYDVGGVANLVHGLYLGGEPTIPPLHFATALTVTAAASGDMWFDGANLRIRVSGTDFTIVKV